MYYSVMFSHICVRGSDSTHHPDALPKSLKITSLHSEEPQSSLFFKGADNLFDVRRVILSLWTQISFFGKNEY